MSSKTSLPFQMTLQVKDACLCLHAQRAARALARCFDEVFRPLGLTNGQFSLMMSLNRPSPPIMGQVAELLSMNRTTLTAALKPLIKRGLVIVQIDSEDRRKQRLALSSAGMSLLVEAYPVWVKTHGEIEALLRDHDPDALRRALAFLSFRLDSMILSESSSVAASQPEGTLGASTHESSDLGRA
ncbi:MAG: MarR family transcriptional regulator [Magnetococcales bacterium]|nr:MarR family transcriptional regulator [Magnetococcales bacterium]